METDLPVKIGMRIKELREAAGLSQAQVADRTGTSISSVSRIERGQMLPTVGTIFAIAKVLGREGYELLPRQSESSTEERALANFPRAHLLSTREKKLVQQVIDHFVDTRGDRSE
jgi:transcriptional regulator with XRE-family HTH domain